MEVPRGCQHAWSSAQEMLLFFFILPSKGFMKSPRGLICQAGLQGHDADCLRLDFA